MPKTGANVRATQRRRKARTVSITNPAPETRSRQILAEIIEEAMAEPGSLKLPDPGAFVSADAAPVTAAPAAVEEEAEKAQPVDDHATRDLVAIAQHGASLELDGAKYSSDELALIAENVSDDAHLRIKNSGGFSAKELATIAKRGPGQVIFA